MFETPWVQREATPNFLQTFRMGQADAQAQQDRASEQNAYQQFAKDPQAGIKAALMAGDGKTAEALRGFQAQDVAAQDAAHGRKLAATAKFAGQLYDASRSQQDVGKAFDMLAPDYARELGATPQEMAQLRQTAVANPGMMGVLSGNAAKQFELHTIKQGERLTDGNGKIIADNPAEPKGYAIPAGGSLAVLGGGGNVSMTPGAGGASQGNAGGPAPAGSRGVRNNNPLNLTTLPNGQWPGQSGVDGKFAVFASPQAGFAAADRNLAGYGSRHGIDTIQGVVDRWAPGSDGNDPAAYAASVARDLGITPTTKINLADPALRQQMLQAMSKVELGGTPSGGAPGGASGGVRIIQGNPKEAKPQYRLATAEENTAHGYPADAKAQVSPDGKYEPQAVDPNAAAPVLGNPTLTGEAFLKTLPPQDRQMIKLMVQGKVPPPTGLAMSKPQVQARLAAAAQYDPTFDESKWKARTVARADVATGQTHKTIQQLGTVMSHLDDLDKSVDALGNTPFKGINKMSNWIEGHLDQPMVGEFNINKTLAAQELRKYFAGGSGGSLEELRSLEDQLDAAKGPKTLHGVIRRIVMLVGDKKDEIERQYTDVMGEPLNIDNQLTAKARAAYARLGGDTAPAPQRAQPRPMPQRAATGPRLSVEQAAKLKPGTPFIGMDGVPRVRH